MNARKFLSSGVVLLALIAGVISTAYAEKVYTDSSGAALGGYDAVSYQKSGAPQMGTSENTYEWNGVKWFFISQSNKESFSQNPERYAPKYGGYCAFAVSKGALAPGDPTVWKVVDDKLYLNLDKSVQSQWESDQFNLIEQANQRWPNLS